MTDVPHAPRHRQVSAYGTYNEHPTIILFCSPQRSTLSGTWQLSRSKILRIKLAILSNSKFCCPICGLRCGLFTFELFRNEWVISNSTLLYFRIIKNVWRASDLDYNMIIKQSKGKQNRILCYKKLVTCHRKLLICIKVLETYNVIFI